jgi:L-asparaginase II
MVEVVRAGIVEAVHRVHAVVVTGASEELVAGDATAPAFLRSAAKPLQALPVLRARPELDDEQLVLCCASHLARPEQLDVVRRTLAVAGVDEQALACGPERILHTCSGKHAGFLALCTAEGWEPAGYERAGHPCQEAMREVVGEATGTAPAMLASGVDGCGVVTFAVPLRVAARTYLRLRELEGGPRVVAAMQRHPELLRGPVAADAAVMRALAGWVAKGGAEGLFCASSPDGIGIALKVDDGSFRPIRAAFAHLLGLLGVEHAGVDDPVVRNARGEEVGWTRVVPATA